MPVSKVLLAETFPGDPTATNEFLCSTMHQQQRHAERIMFTSLGHRGNRRSTQTVATNCKIHFPHVMLVANSGNPVVHYPCNADKPKYTNSLLRYSSILEKFIPKFVVSLRRKLFRKKTPFCRQDTYQFNELRSEFC